MLASSIQNQLTTARDQQFEVEVLIEGRSIYPSLIVTDFDDDSCSFVGAEGYTLTMLNERITGVIVHTQAPRWWTAQREGGYADNIDVREKDRTKSKTTSREPAHA